ncbi:hypothetical protein GCM10009745_25730 [Kribbella yunnanensis]|uniref:Uncharacterized protein n=1 Tax=Kribbella yunnanensis TaxID=190194 RepID=A0ABN2H1V3_9ACTN
MRPSAGHLEDVLRAVQLSHDLHVRLACQHRGQCTSHHRAAVAESHSDHRMPPSRPSPHLPAYRPRNGENQLPDGGARVSINE